MKVEVISKTKYTTDDGRVFLDKTRAEQHEEKLKHKTVHYIIDFAHLTIRKACYLKVKEQVIDRYSKPERTYTYETESGVAISDNTIQGNHHIIIMTEEQYNKYSQDLEVHFKIRKQYEETYSADKFVNPPITKGRTKKK